MTEQTMFALTRAQRGLAEMARRLAALTFQVIADAGVPGRVNRPLVVALGSTGLLGPVFDETSGALELCVLREALAQECTDAETALAMQGLGGVTIQQAGRPEVADRWVPAIANGEAVAAFALSEPERGTDAGAIELAATGDPEAGYRLSGVKTWISNAPDADVYVVFARTTPDAGAKGVSAFVVAADSPGLSGEPIELLSGHPIGRLTFDGVQVPSSNLLGEPDHGFRVAMRTLDRFRPSVGAFAVGMAQAALDHAREHAERRHAFGRPIREFQAVSHPLAEMAT